MTVTNSLTITKNDQSTILNGIDEIKFTFSVTIYNHKEHVPEGMDC